MNDQSQIFYTAMNSDAQLNSYKYIHTCRVHINGWDFDSGVDCECNYNNADIGDNSRDSGNHHTP